MATSAWAADRLSGSPVRPVGQAIELRLDPSESSYRGAVEIELAVAAETETFRLHSVDQAFERVALSGPAGEIGVAYERAGDLVTLRPARPLAAGRYRVAIEYTAEFSAPLDGLYTVERDGAHYAFSVFQPIAARRAFPCFDEPGFKIPFRVTLTVPAGNLALSTGRELDATVADGWRTVRFAETPPLPSYAVAFAVGPFDTVPIEGLGVPARIVTARGRAASTALATARVAELLPYLERYFHEPYPYAKLDLLAVPEFPSGGLENAAAIVFSEDVLLVAADAPVQRQLAQAITVAHELAHMWFGNLVTLEWWNDAWLNESFATWMAYKAVDEVLPELRADALRQRRLEHAFELDAQADAVPIRRPFDSPEEAFTVSAPLVYDKGAQLLRMLEGWIGTERFRVGVAAYLDSHAAKSASAADFWGALDRAAGRSVATGLRGFLDRPGYPRIDVARRGDRLLLEQERFVRHGRPADGARWSVPVQLKRIVGDRQTVETVELRESDTEPRPATDALAAGEIVYPNASALGYYRWSFPAERLHELAAVAGDALSPVERLDLLGNVAAELAAGRLGGDAYLEIVAPAVADADPVVALAALDGLTRTGTVLVGEESAAAYAAYLRRVLGPAWDRVGAVSRPGESAYVDALRAALYRTLGGAGGDATLRRDAQARVRGLLAEGVEKPTADSPEPTLLAPALRVAARTGDPALFEAYLGRLAATREPGARRDLIEALAEFPDPALRRRALDGYLAGTLDLGELLVLVGALQRDAAGADVLWLWFTERYDAVAAQLPPFLHSFLPRFADGCSMERLAAAETFFAVAGRRAAGTELQLAQVGEKVRDCVELAQRERARVARHLAAIQ